MIWLLRFEWAGQTWYLASQPCTPLLRNADGTTTPLPHYPTLEPPQFAESLSWAQSSIGTCSVSVAFRLDLAPDKDVAYLHFAENQRLETAVGELALWREGDYYQDRLAQVFGPFTPDRIPLYNRAITGVLTQRFPTTAALFPPSTAQATPTTWPNLPTEDTESADQNGFPYPCFLGYGGAYTDDLGTARRAGCIQAIYVDNAPDTVLFSYGHVVATTVRIGSVENGSAFDFTVILTFDGLGQPVSVADISGVGWSWAVGPEDDSFYVTELNGGLPVAFGNRAIRGIGDAILYLLLQRYGDDAPALVDVAAWITALPYLNQFRIGLNITEGADPFDTINTSLMPLCPALYLCQGPAGIRPVILSSDDPSTCRRLVAREDGRDGPDLFREPDQEPELAQNDPVNAAAVYFAYRVRTGDLRATSTLDAAQTPDGAASLIAYGPRAVAVEAPCVYDRPTAANIAAELVRLYAMRATFDTWVAPMDVGATLVLGQRVLITDEAAGYDDSPMSIIAREVVTTENGQAWLITAIRY